MYRTVLRPDGSDPVQTLRPPNSDVLVAHIYDPEGCIRRCGITTERSRHIDQDAEAGTVTAFFEDGSNAAGDLLVGADGSNSTVRAQFWPDMRPSWAGYLAWRGLVTEDDMPAAAREMLLGDFGFANNKHSHILGYLVPASITTSARATGSTTGSGTASRMNAC